MKPQESESKNKIKPATTSVSIVNYNWELCWDFNSSHIFVDIWFRIPNSNNQIQNFWRDLCVTDQLNPKENIRNNERQVVENRQSKQTNMNRVHDYLLEFACSFIRFS